MAEIRMAIITMTRGEFIAPAWREPGTVLQVEQDIADRWIKHGSAVLGGNADEVQTNTNVTPGEFETFPGAALFVAAGVNSVDGVKALIEQFGDAWPKSVKGMTKAIALKVSELLETASQNQ